MQSMFYVIMQLTNNKKWRGYEFTKLNKKYII